MNEVFLCVGRGCGHTFGVRVDGPLARGFLRFLSLTAFQAEGCGSALRAQSFISRLRRSRQHRVSILSAYLVHPFASSRHFPSRGNESVTGLAFCVIWHDKHSGDWLTAFATPYPAVTDFSTGKRVARFSGRFASLRIVFPCHPYAGGRIKHRETIIS